MLGQAYSPITSKGMTSFSKFVKIGLDQFGPNEAGKK
jgi:hypothetical protein